MVKTIFIYAKYKGEIKLSDEILEYLREKKVKSVALFASVQFLELDDVKKQLEESEVVVNVCSAKRASVEGQLLGCDCYSDCFGEGVIGNSDAVLYIGDGGFHPSALVFAQVGKEIKPVIVYSPISKSFRVLGVDDIKPQIEKTCVNLRKFINCEKIGILVTTKPGQSHLSLALKLKKQLENEGKKVFVFMDNKFDFSGLENFNFIECWVNSACPRIGTDDILNISVPVVNIADSFNSVESLERLSKSIS